MVADPDGWPEGTPLYVKHFWPAPNAKARPNGNGYVAPGSGATDAYARAAQDRELAELAATPQGRRNDQLNIAAFNLGQLVGGGVLDRDEVEHSLTDTALATGLPAGEVRATLASGLLAGEAHARGVPQRDDDPLPEPTVLGDIPPRVEDPGDPAPADALAFVDWHEAFANESVEEWVVEPLIPARRLIALFSPAKTGKSLLMLELAVAISRGDPVMSVEVDRARRVLYVDFENDLTGDVVPRLRAMGYEAGDLDELRYLSFPSLPYLDNAMGGLVLTDACDRHEIEVVVIDTISRAVGGEENDNDTWLGFYKHTGVALKGRGITVVRLDHTGKDITRGMRGGSAKYSDVDAAWQMLRLDDTRLHLECVANRLPITDKKLTLLRKTDPLRHVVTADPVVDIVADRVRGLMEVLDRLHVPREHGKDKCKNALREASLPFNSDDLADAIRLRKASVESPTVVGDLTQGLWVRNDEP